MRRSAKNKILLLCFLFVGTIFVLRTLSPKKEPQKVSQIKAPASKNVKTYEVLVAKEDINAGDEITYYNITRKKIDAQEMFPGFVTVKASKDILGKKIAKVDLKAGDFIDRGILGSSHDEWGMVKPGMSVKSIEMKVNEGIGSILKPGMIVRIIYNEEGKNASIIDSARVIIVRGQKNADEENTSAKEEVFIEVTPQLAQMLALPHKGNFTLIPIKKHPDPKVPDGYYKSDDISKMLFSSQNKKPQRSVIRSIRGNKIDFVDVENKISKQVLNEAPAKIEEEITPRAKRSRLKINRTKSMFVPIYEFYDHEQIKSPYIIDYKIIDLEEAK